MSEYQYYEFQAVDHPLDDGAIRALRALSSRARITPTSFINHYDWGSFKGSPASLVEKHFDLFLYLANWGTRELMIRLPRRVFEAKRAEPYLVDDCAWMSTTKQHVILTFHSENEDGDWEDDGSGWLAALAALRADLLRGDRRCLYLGWLIGVQAGYIDDSAREPPRPRGLARLSGPPLAFAEFMNLDTDLLAAAAAVDDGDPPGAAPAEIEAWVRALPEEEKSAALLRVVRGDDPHVGAELFRRFEREMGAPAPADGDQRTVAEILAAAERRATASRQRQAAVQAKERARREREAAVAETQRLNALAARGEKAWREVENLIETRQPNNYDRAIALLKDLRDLGERSGEAMICAERIRLLRQRHLRKTGLLRRLAGIDVPA